MTEQSIIETKAAIFETGLLFGVKQQPSEAMINAYARALSNYSPKQITFAFNQVILSGSAFFPSLAEVLAHLRPVQETKEDIAPRIVSEMLQALRDFSQYDEEQMLASVSEEARLTFKMLGSTFDIRTSEEPEIVKAQLRGLVKSVLSNREAITQAVKLQSIGLTTKSPGLSKIDFGAMAGAITQ